MRILMWAVTVVVIMNLTACHTMQGFGEDLQQVGGSIERKADK